MLKIYIRPTRRTAQYSACKNDLAHCKVQLIAPSFFTKLPAIATWASQRSSIEAQAVMESFESGPSKSHPSSPMERQVPTWHVLRHGLPDYGWEGKEEATPKQRILAEESKLYQCGFRLTWHSSTNSVDCVHVWLHNKHRNGSSTPHHSWDISWIVISPSCANGRTMLHCIRKGFIQLRNIRLHREEISWEVWTSQKNHLSPAFRQ